MKKELILPSHVKKEIDKEGTNVVPMERPKLAHGGGTPPSKDWLSDLFPGTIFLVHPKGKETVNLLEYHLIYQLEKAVYLRMCDPMQTQEIYVYVNPVIFCQMYDLYQVIVDGSEQPPAEEE